MKKAITFLIPLSLSLSLAALPSQGEIVSGDAAFKNVNPALLQIVTSDKAIINYSDFNIGEKEKVQFIQPSKDATVLNRIISKNPSQILGSLEANGKVFLVNPNGIYFGKDASVNTGAFLASTLNISDKDFLNGTFSFTTPKNSTSSIVNEGSLNSPEGFIALLAPTVENKGSVIAESGRILIGSAEKITLDFSGDGLMKFSLDGELEKALIENGGLIKAQDGSVNLSLKAANKAIKMTVNTDGITPANHLEEVNGLIVLSAKGAIKGDVIHIEGQDGSAIQISGALDASNLKDTSSGGSIKILGDQISLKGASIEASGNTGGGEILIGGDYKGEGAVRNAKNTVVDEGSTIQADALATGNGGRVILWSDGVTLFNGKISAKGGYRSGNGGFVETSGKRGLGIRTGSAITTAHKGTHGTWLLDPDTITITSNDAPGTLAQAADDTDLTNAVTIKNSIFTGLSGSILLYANSGITLEPNADINTGANLKFLPISNNPAWKTTVNSNIQANSISFGQDGYEGGVVIGASGLSLSTFGGDITFFTTLDSLDKTQDITLNAGNASKNASVILKNATGSQNAFTSFNVIGQKVQLSSDINVTNDITFIGEDPTTHLSVRIPTTLEADVTLTAQFLNLGSFDGPYNLVLNSTFVGDSEGTPTSTIGAIGSTAPLASLKTTSLSFFQQGTVQTTGPVSYTATDNLQINGSITTNGGAITLDGPATMLVDLGLDTTNEGASPEGADITANSIDSWNIPTHLSLKGGTAGTVTMGAIGTTNPLSNLITAGATINQLADVKVDDTIQYTAGNINISGNIITTNSGTLNLTGNTFILDDAIIGLVSSDADSTLFSTITTGPIDSGKQTPSDTHQYSLQLLGDTTSIITTGTIGSVNPLSSLTTTSKTFNQNGDISTAGVVSHKASQNLLINGSIITNGAGITLVGPTKLGADLSLDTTNNGGDGAENGADIVVDEIDSSGTARALTVAAGTEGAITFNKAIGGASFLNTLEASAKTINQASPVNVTTKATYHGDTLNIGGNITANNAGTIELNGPISLLGDGIVFDTSKGATSSSTPRIQISSVDTSGDSNTPYSLSLKGGTAGTVMMGAIGSIHPLSSLTASAATINQNSAINTKGDISLTGTTAINVQGDIVSQGAGITLVGATAFSPLSTTPLQDTIHITSTGGTINLPATTGAMNVNIDAGSTGVINLTSSSGSATSPLQSLTTNSGTLNQQGTVATTGPLTHTSKDLQIKGSIVTKGSAITLIGPATILTNLNLDTTNNTLAAAGANITIDEVNGSGSSLSLLGGTSGVITFNKIIGGPNSLGQLNPLDQLVANGNSITQFGSVTTAKNVRYVGSPLKLYNNINTTSSGTILLSGSTSLFNNITLDTTAGSTTLSPTSISVAAVDTDLTSSSLWSLTLSAGANGTLSTGAIGATNPLASLTTASKILNQTGAIRTTGAVTHTSGDLEIGGNITTNKGAITLTGPTRILTDVILDATNSEGVGAENGADITVGRIESIGSGQTPNLTLTVKSGTAGNYFSNDTIGSSVPLQNLSVTANNVNQKSSVKATKSVLYTGNALNISGNITTTNAGTIKFNGPAFLLNNGITFDVSQGSTLSTPSTIQVGTVDIDPNSSATYSVSLIGGSGGIVTMGAIGGANSKPLSSFTASGSTVNQNSTINTKGAINLTGTTAINAQGDIVSQVGNVTLTGATNFSAPNATIDTIHITSTGGTINLPATTGAMNINIDAGSTGVINLTSSTGSATSPLKSLTTNSAKLNQQETVATTGPLTHTSKDLQINGSIVTKGNVITLNGPVTLLTDLDLDTTSNNPSGADISVNKIESTGSGTYLTLLGGTAGKINLNGTIGAATPLTNLTTSGSVVNQKSSVKATKSVQYTAGALNISGNITTTNAGTINFNGPAFLLTDGLTFNASQGSTLSTPSNIQVGTVDIDPNSSTTYSASLIGGSGGIVTMGAIGGANSKPLSSFTASGATINQNSNISSKGAINLTGTTAINVQGDIVSQVGNITLTGATNFSAPTATPLLDTINITSNGGTISLPATNGAMNVIIDAGTTGTISLTSTTGSATPLTSLKTSANSLTQFGAVTTRGSVKHTSPSVQISSNITTSGGAITLDTTGGSATLKNGLKLDTTNSGATATGADISVGTLDSFGSGTALNILAGTNGVVSLYGTVGKTTPFASISNTSKAINVAGDIKVSGTAGTIQIRGSMNLLSDVVIKNQISGSSVVASAITLSAVDGLHSLTLDAGSLGTISLFSPIGGTYPLTTLTTTAETIQQRSTVTATNGVTYNGKISLTGDVKTVNKPITLNGPITLFSDVALNTNNSTVNQDGADVVFGSSSIDEPSTGATGTTGKWKLLLNLGNKGKTTLPAIGSKYPLKSVTVQRTYPPAQNLYSKIKNSFSSKEALETDPSVNPTLTLSQGITVSGGAVTFNVPVLVNGDTQISTVGYSAAGSDIVFAQDLQSASKLTLLSGTGTATFSGTNPVSLGALTVSGNSWIAPSITATSGDIKLSGNVTGASGTTLTLTGANMELGAVQADEATLKAAKITLKETVTTSGHLTLDGDVSIPHGSFSKLECGSLSITGTTTLP